MDTVADGYRRNNSAIKAYDKSVYDSVFCTPEKTKFPSETIPPEVFKPQGGLLRLAQIHSSQYEEFVFAFYGGAEGNDMHFCITKIKEATSVCTGGSNSPPDCCTAMGSIPLIIKTVPIKNTAFWRYFLLVERPQPSVNTPILLDLCRQNSR